MSNETLIRETELAVDLRDKLQTLNVIKEDGSLNSEIFLRLGEDTVAPSNTSIYWFNGDPSALSTDTRAGIRFNYTTNKIESITPGLDWTLDSNWVSFGGISQVNGATGIVSSQLGSVITLTPDYGAGQFKITEGEHITDTNAHGGFLSALTVNKKLVTSQITAPGYQEGAVLSSIVGYQGSIELTEGDGIALDAFDGDVKITNTGTRGLGVGQTPTFKSDRVTLLEPTLAVDGNRYLKIVDSTNRYIGYDSFGQIVDGYGVEFKNHGVVDITLSANGQTLDPSITGYTLDYPGNNVSAKKLNFISNSDVTIARRNTSTVGEQNLEFFINPPLLKKIITQPAIVLDREVGSGFPDLPVVNPGLANFGPFYGAGKKIEMRASDSSISGGLDRVQNKLFLTSVDFTDSNYSDGQVIPQSELNSFISAIQGPIEINTPNDEYLSLLPNSTGTSFTVVRFSGSDLEELPVVSFDIREGGIKNKHIADDTITGDKIVSIPANKIVGSIGSAVIDPLSITSIELAPGSVINTKIGIGAVDNTKIQSQTIRPDNLNIVGSGLPGTARYLLYDDDTQLFYSAANAGTGGGSGGSTLQIGIEPEPVTSPDTKTYSAYSKLVYSSRDFAFNNSGSIGNGTATATIRTKGLGYNASTTAPTSSTSFLNNFKNISFRLPDFSVQTISNVNGEVIYLGIGSVPANAIQNGSITDAKLASGISASKILGKVGSASVADSAATAGTAITAGNCTQAVRANALSANVNLNQILYVNFDTVPAFVGQTWRVVVRKRNDGAYELFFVP